MEKRLSYGVLLGALALIACGPPAVSVCGPGGSIICSASEMCVLGACVPADAAVVPDAGGDGDTGVRPDAPDTGMTCGQSGRVGSECLGGATCASGLTCGMPRGGTVQELFGFRQGNLEDPAHPGYQSVQDPANPAEAGPFNGLAGTLCIQECDLGAMTDGCGSCASCSNDFTQMPLINALGGAGQLFGADAAFENSGVCRLDCEFDPAERGDACPDEQTCSSFEATCVEQCTSNVECNTAYGVTYTGEFVTLVGTENPATCNSTTGRCEYAGTAGAAIGDPCDGPNDCAPGLGVCLNGGQCAELGCTALNCGGTGLCLGINDRQTICVQGCNSVNDCEPGNICNSIGTPMGGFSGFCFGPCEGDEECRDTETCTDFVDADGEPQTGTCVPRCPMADVRGTAGGCEADEYCRRDHDGEDYGRCAPLGAFCSIDMGATTPGQSEDCGAGQICDELLATGGGPGFDGRDIFGDGHCVDACDDDADCAGLAGTTCQTSGPAQGLCRTPCTTTPDCASTNQMCDTTNMICTEIPAAT